MSNVASHPMRYIAVPDGAGGTRHVLRAAPPTKPGKNGRKAVVPDPIKASAEAAAQMLAQYIERAECIGAEIVEKQADLADVFAEAKSQGFSVATMKTMIARRKKERDALLEEDALLETYRAALGQT